MLHKALADAQRKGTVFRNVASLADAPKLSSRQRPAMRVWEAHELRHFLEIAESRRHYPAFFLAAHTGMRRGEVLGLRWNDVDLDARRLSVSRSVVSVGYDLQLSTPKTGTGRRTIDLDHRTVNVLRAWKETQATERTIPSADANPWGDLTFSRPDGTPVHPDIFSQAFDRVVASTELPVISFHDLRHTHASLLLKAGVPVKVVSERLGHANPAFTMNVYQHVIPGMQAQAANTFSQLLQATEDHVEDGGEERVDGPPEPLERSWGWA